MDDVIMQIKEMAIAQHKANPEIFNDLWRKASIKALETNVRAIVLVGKFNQEKKRIDFFSKNMVEFIGGRRIEERLLIEQLLMDYVKAIVFGYIPLICMSYKEPMAMFAFYPLGVLEDDDDEEDEDE